MAYAYLPKTTVVSEELNDLPATARWLYVVMVAERAGRQGKFRLPYRELHRITRFSTSTIRRAIVELERAGFLEYEHGGLEQNPNKYELDQDWLEWERN